MGQPGRQPFPLAVMLRVYFVQPWYGLSDPGAGEALYGTESGFRFAGLKPGRGAIPGETTILSFRLLLERHDLTKALFNAAAGHLEEHNLLLRVLRSDQRGIPSSVCP